MAEEEKVQSVIAKQPQVGFIYKITGGEECYIGATKTGIMTRLSQHRSRWNRYKTGKEPAKCQSYDLFEKYGDDCRIEVLHVVHYHDRKDLRRMELETIETTPGCINKNRPIITKEQHLEKMKEWRKDNKEYSRNYLEQLIECECGIVVQLHSKTHHLRGKVHQRRMEENPLRAKLGKEEKKPPREQMAKRDMLIPCGCGAKIKAKQFSQHSKTTAHIVWLQAQKSKQLIAEAEEKNK